MNRYKIKLIPKVANVYYAEIDGIPYKLPLVNRYKQEKLCKEQIRILDNRLHEYEKLIGVKLPLDVFKELM